MRTVAATTITQALLDTQEDDVSHTPYIKIYINSTDYSSRLLYVEHHEESYRDFAIIGLSNRDGTLDTLNLHGKSFNIGYGYDTSGHGGSTTDKVDTAPLWVKSYQIISVGGERIYQIYAEGAWMRLREQKVITGVTGAQAGDATHDPYGNTFDATHTIYALLALVIETAMGWDLVDQVPYSELMANAAFDSDITGWTNVNGSQAWQTPGYIRKTATGVGAYWSYGSCTVVVGQYYWVTVELITGYTADNRIISIGTAKVPDAGYNTYAYTSGATTGTYTYLVKATTTSLFINLGVTNANGKYADFDNCSVKQATYDAITEVFKPVFEVSKSTYENAAALIYRLLWMTKCYLRLEAKIGTITTPSFRVIFPQSTDTVDETYYSNYVNQYMKFIEYTEKPVLLIPNSIVVLCNKDSDGGWDNLIVGTDSDAVSVAAYAELVQPYIDGSITTQANADLRAQAILARLKAENLAGRLIIPHDARVELYDKMDIIDNRTSSTRTWPSDEVVRVSNIIHWYNRDKGIYQLEVSLGEVSADFGMPIFAEFPRPTVEEGVKTPTAIITPIAPDFYNPKDPFVGSGVQPQPETGPDFYNPNDPFGGTTTPKQQPDFYNPKDTFPVPTKQTLWERLSNWSERTKATSRSNDIQRTKALKDFFSRTLKQASNFVPWWRFDK